VSLACTGEIAKSLYCEVFGGSKASLVGWNRRGFDPSAHARAACIERRRSTHRFFVCTPSGEEAAGAPVPTRRIRFGKRHHLWKTASKGKASDFVRLL